MRRSRPAILPVESSDVTDTNRRRKPTASGASRRLLNSDTDFTITVRLCWSPVHWLLSGAIVSRPDDVIRVTSRADTASGLRVPFPDSVVVRRLNSEPTLVTPSEVAVVSGCGACAEVAASVTPLPVPVDCPPVDDGIARLPVAAAVSAFSTASTPGGRSRDVTGNGMSPTTSEPEVVFNSGEGGASLLGDGSSVDVVVGRTLNDDDDDDDDGDDDAGDDDDVDVVVGASERLSRDDIADDLVGRRRRRPALSADDVPPGPLLVMLPSGVAYGFLSAVHRRMPPSDAPSCVSSRLSRRTVSTNVTSIIVSGPKNAASDP